MKTFFRWSFFVTALLTILVMGALAQDDAEKPKLRTEIANKVQVELAKSLGTQFRFETKVVKGSPYSAIAEAETVQLLSDGNRIRNKSITTVYRDSEGRTRREMVGKISGVADEIFISDPVSGVSYSLVPQHRMAFKSQPSLQLKTIEEKKLVEQAMKQRTLSGEQQGSVVVEGQQLRLAQLAEDQRAIAEKKMLAEKEMKMATDMKTREKMEIADSGGMLRKKEGQKELLGQQMVEGVMCQGQRTTVTIPANSIGNDLPINIVSEEWYSPELQVLVLTKHSDPRTGETVYRLTNINRSEPDRSMFEVPADYTIKEPGMVPMMKRRTEEQ
ncbi:MAG: hypothetical protein KA368_14435 [Acidobacteria bacterium]|nr:hypothetical protein [Acidobacteriota bacterium]